MHPLVLFDIDGTLMRRAGPHHGQALIEAVRRVSGATVAIAGIPVAGMLDRDILTAMLAAAGFGARESARLLPGIIHRAQHIYPRLCPDLRRRVCPGVRRLLPRLIRHGAVTGLVTGNLSRIGWKKMDRAGLRPYFRFGAFAEMGRSRAELARIARRHAIAQGWIARNCCAVLIGDHPNDILAAREAGLRSIAVATGVVPRVELEHHRPDILLNDLREFKLEMIA